MADQIGTFEESLARYRHLIEHSTDVIYWTNNDGRFNFFGPSATQAFGYSREELLGRHYLEMVRPDKKRAVRRYYDIQWAKRIPHTYLEIPIITKDSREIWLGQNVHLIQTTQGPSGFQVIARNVTGQKQSREELERLVGERTADLQAANEALRKEIADRRQAEEERERMEEQLRQVQRLESLGLLAGGVAHEFNNLLMIVSGYAEILRVGVPEPPKYLAYLDRVLGASRRGEELAQQMLDYAGKGRLEPERVHLSKLLRDCAPIFEEAIAGRTRLILDLADGLPEFMGDCRLVQQIAMALILNAVDALEQNDGTVQVRTRVMDATPAFFSRTYFGEQLTPGKYVVLEVIDNGCGMDAATQHRMFEPFYSTKFMGRGLGLAAALGIVKSHEGAITVHSTPGQGTTIQVVFPARQAE